MSGIAVSGGLICWGSFSESCLAGPFLEQPGETIVVGECCRSEAEDGFGAGEIAPEHFRALDPVVEFLHRRIHPGAGGGQAFAAVASVVHSFGIVLKIPDRQSQTPARIGHRPQKICSDYGAVIATKDRKTTRK